MQVGGNGDLVGIGRAETGRRGVLFGVAHGQKQVHYALLQAVTGRQLDYKVHVVAVQSTHIALKAVLGLNHAHQRSLRRGAKPTPRP